VLAEDGGAFEAELVEVAVDGAAGVPVALDEGRVRGAAAQRLEPHGAGAREEIQHVRVLGEPRADEVERRLTDAVTRRPGRPPFRREDPSALPRAGDDPHHAPTCDSPKTRSTSSAS